MQQPPPGPQTPEDWDAASEGYQRFIAPLTALYAGVHIDRLDIDGDSRVLEVAAGTGSLTEELAPRVEEVLATDLSPGMLDRLRARLASRDITNVQCIPMDGQALDLEDESFDRAVCSFGVMLFPDRARGFSELRRVLRPGGRAVLSAWDGPDRFECLGTFLGALRRAVPDLPAPATPPPIFSLADPARFTAEMEAAGFRDVQIDFVEREYVLEGFEAVWELLTVGASPVPALLERIGARGADRIRETLQSDLAERFGDGPLRFSNVATVGVGVA